MNIKIKMIYTICLLYTSIKLARIEEPIAKGLALGTSAHAIGTAKAMELGEIEGAMSLSLIHISY